jgi:ribosomal protein S18 acetylase RimI-like enzyme
VTAQPFTIRAAVPADADALAELHTRTWREAYGHLIVDPAHPAYDVERRRTMWHGMLAADPPRSAPHVAVAQDGTLVGFADAATSPADDSPRPLELTMIYALEAVHGSGVGQALLDTVIADRPAFLWVAADNPRARAFYRRNGFEPDGATGTFGPIDTVRLVR